ncbi:MAG: hypothetical protein P8N43_08805 [Alphaproteobacteria bacterium]|nr:hypothetical protein [Alphaproteobacteria bacterium]
MFRSPIFALLLLTTVSLSVMAEDGPKKTTDVTLRALTLKVPADWKKSAKPSSMRLATFDIAAAEKDGRAAELAIYNFPGGGGSVEANISRWIGQFESKGRASKVTVGKAGTHDYYFIEVSGTYNQPVGPPIRRQTKAFPGSRMLGVILTMDSGVYFLKMTGPDKTVEAQADALRMSFGGDGASEKEAKE